MKKYDFIAIGGGSAGIASANRAAERGAKALIIEKESVGGTCVNKGCVPKKIMWYGSQVRDAITKYAPEYGFEAELKNFDFQTLKANRQAYIDRVHKSYHSGFETRETDFIQGTAKFIDNNTIEVNGEHIQGEHIAIAVGARPNVINISGIELAENSDDFFEWDELPESVLMIGAGYISVEIASVLNGLGVKTTLVDVTERPLARFDRDITSLLQSQMDLYGIEFYGGHAVNNIEKNADGSLTASFDNGRTITAEKIIQAVGRKPNSDLIGLENTDVKVDDRGYIIVDKEERTNVPGIYAFGDIINETPLTPVAVKAGRLLAERLFNNQSEKMDYDLIPTVVFSHPAIGKIGLTEEEAVENYGADQIKVYQSNFTSMYTALGSNREPSRFKLVTLGEEERVIGLHGIGYGVDEMIQGFGVAMKMGATKKDFDSVVAIHPTGSEEFVTMR